MPRLNELYPPRPMLDALSPLRGDSLELSGGANGTARWVYCPVTVAEAVSLRGRHPQAKIVAGATDVGVQLNKRAIDPVAFLDLNRVADLEGAKIERHADRRVLVAGARATWTEILEICRKEEPEFAKIIAVFGSPQIRHVGTIGGNVINESPIADSPPFMFVMEAELELVGPKGSRRVNINDFYRGYKQFDLNPDELLASVRIPLPRKGEIVRLFKVSRRRDLDISTFTGAFRLRLDGDKIADAAVAYGAVGPMVLRMRKTEQFLRGKTFDETAMEGAGDVAVSEITPISDVRGSKEYRNQLARNVLLKLFHEQHAVTA